METDYLRYLKLKEEEYESLCRRCGGCCGAYDDPCLHLKKQKEGIYYCDIYPHRFGEHKTVTGESFICVPIREIINEYWPKDYLCVYKKLGKW